MNKTNIWNNKLNCKLNRYIIYNKYLTYKLDIEQNGYMINKKGCETGIFFFCWFHQFG